MSEQVGRPTPATELYAAIGQCVPLQPQATFDTARFVISAGLIIPEIALRFPYDENHAPVVGYEMLLTNCDNRLEGVGIARIVALSELNTSGEMQQALNVPTSHFKDGWQISYWLKKECWPPQNPDAPEATVQSKFHRSSESLQTKTTLQSLLDAVAAAGGPTAQEPMARLQQFLDGLYKESRQAGLAVAQEQELGLHSPPSDNELRCLTGMLRRALAS